MSKNADWLVRGYWRYLTGCVPSPVEEKKPLDHSVALHLNVHLEDTVQGQDWTLLDCRLSPVVRTDSL